MKKILIYFATACLLFTFTQSCKKGDGDPLVSLLTRTQRLTGTWKVTKEESKIEYRSTAMPDTSIITNVIYDGIKAVATTVYSNKTSSFKAVDTTYYEDEIRFDKDGKYTKSISYNLTSIRNTTEGNWIFLGKSEAYDLKNKEAILLTISSYLTTDGTNTQIMNYKDLDGETLVINQLKNKQLIITNNKTFTNDNSLESGSMTVKTTYEAK